MAFGILGISIYWATSYSLSWAVVSTVIAAACDEGHQYFVTGRSSRLGDVVLDTLAAITFILIARMIKKKADNIVIYKKIENLQIVDLHSHILPNIDDGAKNMAMSLAMLQIAKDNGTKSIVATPHVMEGEGLPAWDRIVTECNALQQASQEIGLDLRMFPGSEVAIYGDILNILTGPGAYCINGGRYLLVELPSTHIPSGIDEFFFTLQVRGITPILAHPERHPQLAKNPEILAKWIGTGVLSQMNGTSITGLMGKRVMATAELLLVNNMVHVIGSDAHSIGQRNTDLTSAVDKITKLIGPQRAIQLVFENADNIIFSRDVDIPKIRDIQYSSTQNSVMHWVGTLWK